MPYVHFAAYCRLIGKEQVRELNAQRRRAWRDAGAKAGF